MKSFEGRRLGDFELNRIEPRAFRRLPAVPSHL